MTLGFETERGEETKANRIVTMLPERTGTAWERCGLFEVSTILSTDTRMPPLQHNQLLPQTKVFRD